MSKKKRLAAEVEQLGIDANKQIAEIKQLTQRVSDLSFKVSRGTSTAAEIKQLTELRHELAAKSKAIRPVARAYGKASGKLHSKTLAARRRQNMRRNAAAWTVSYLNKQTQPHNQNQANQTDDFTVSVATDIANAARERTYDAWEVHRVKQRAYKEVERAAKASKTAKKRQASVRRRKNNVAKRAVLKQGSLSAGRAPAGFFGRVLHAGGTVANAPFAALRAVRSIKALGVLGLLSLPVIMLMPLILTRAFGLSLFTSMSASASGGDALKFVSIVKSEYQAGYDAGTFHQGDPKYWTYVVGSKFINGRQTPWCACFVSWCANEATLVSSNLFPKSASVSAYGEWFSKAEHGEIITDLTTYTPRAGDLILYGWPDGEGSHIGVVTDVFEDGSFDSIEGNTSNTEAGGQSTGNTVGKHHHTKSQNRYSFWTKASIARPNYPASGGTIQIPEPYGTAMTYTGYGPAGWYYPDGSTRPVAKDSDDWAVWDMWKRAGAHYNNHIATLNGRYLIACATTFGRPGDSIDFFLSDGTVIPCTIADTKNPTDKGMNQYGHNNGRDVVEFEVDMSWARAHGNPGSTSWMPEWAGKRVVSAKNNGRAI